MRSPEASDERWFARTSFRSPTAPSDHKIQLAVVGSWLAISPGRRLDDGALDAIDLEIADLRAVGVHGIAVDLRATRDITAAAAFGLARCQMDAFDDHWEFALISERDGACEVFADLGIDALFEFVPVAECRRPN